MGTAFYWNGHHVVLKEDKKMIPAPQYQTQTQQYQEQIDAHVCPGAHKPVMIKIGRTRDCCLCSRTGRDINMGILDINKHNREMADQPTAQISIQLTKDEWSKLGTILVTAASVDVNQALILDKVISQITYNQRFNKTIEQPKEGYSPPPELVKWLQENIKLRVFWQALPTWEGESKKETVKSVNLHVAGDHKTTEHYGNGRDELIDRTCFLRP